MTEEPALIVKSCFDCNVPLFVTAETFTIPALVPAVDSNTDPVLLSVVAVIVALLTFCTVPLLDKVVDLAFKLPSLNTEPLLVSISVPLPDLSAISITVFACNVPVLVMALFALTVSEPLSALIVPALLKPVALVRLILPVVLCIPSSVPAVVLMAPVSELKERLLTDLIPALLNAKLP